MELDAWPEFIAWTLAIGAEVVFLAVVVHKAGPAIARLIEAWADRIDQRGTDGGEED